MVRIIVIVLCTLISCAHQESSEKQGGVTQADIEKFIKPGASISTGPTVSQREIVRLPESEWYPSPKTDTDADAKAVIPAQTSPAQLPDENEGDTPMGYLPESNFDGINAEDSLAESLEEDALDYEAEDSLEIE